MNHPKTGEQELERLAELIHVVPLYDIKEHEESLTCWCCPKVSEESKLVIVHNVFAESYGNERNLE
jgi:hypothetical protein